MREDARYVLAAAFVVALLGSPVVAGVAADGGNSTGTATVANNSSSAAAQYTIRGLRQLGPHPSAAPDSMRPWGDAGSLWVRHVPTGLFVPADSQRMREYVSSTTVVRRQAVYLGAFTGWKESFNGTVHVVVWDVRDVQVETANGTHTRQELKVLAESTTPVSLDPYEETRVDVPPAYNGTAYATMWLEGHRDKTQWVFRVDSSTASQSVPISSKGDAIKWGLAWLFLPLLLTAAGMVAFDRKVLEKAGRGPNVGAIEYAFFACAGLFLGGFVFYNGVIETLARAPYLLGVVGGLFIGLFAIWAFSDRGDDVLFLQFTAADGTAAEDGSGDWHLANRVHTVVERADGKKVVPRDGWLPLLARVWPGYDAAPVLEFDAPETSTSHRRLESPPRRDDVDLPDDAGVWDRVRTWFRGSDPDDEYDVVYLIDPTAEDVVEYDAESFEVAFPSLVEWPDEDSESGVWVQGVPVPSVAVGKLVGGLVVVLTAYFAGTAFFASSSLGGLVASLAALVLVVRPAEGRALVQLAPAHYDAVIGNMIQHLEGYSERADAEHYQRKYHESEARRRAARKEETEQRDHNVFRELSDRLAPEDSPRNGRTEVSSDD